MSEKKQDVCIANFKALMLLAIVFYHAWGAVREYIHTPQILPDNYLSWFCSSLSYCLACFFFVSGYFSWHCQEKISVFLRKKIKSILIPYICWNILYLLIFIIGAIFLPIIRQRVSALELNRITGIINAVIGYPRPADGPLWYLRDLFVLSLFSPLFYFVLKKIPAVFFAALVIAGYFKWLPLSPYIVISFGLGMFFRIRQISLYSFCRFRKIGVLCLLLFLSGTWIYYIYPQCETIRFFLWDGCHVLLLPACLCWMDKCDFSAESFIYRYFTAPSFYIYALHGLIVSLIARLIVAKMPQCTYLSVVALPFTLLLGLALILISYRVLQKIAPKILSVLCGQRS